MLTANAFLFFMLLLAVAMLVTLASKLNIPSIAYGVVLFTLFVQSTTMLPLLKKLKPELTILNLPRFWILSSSPFSSTSERHS